LNPQDKDHAYCSQILIYSHQVTHLPESISDSLHERDDEVRLERIAVKGHEERAEEAGIANQIEQRE